jgi:type II secretory pathway component PulC
LKVSKPILIALIVSVIFSVYMIFFTGKKKIVPAMPQSTSTLNSNMQSVGQQEGGQQVKTPIKPVKTDFTWKRDPFFVAQPTDKNMTEPKVQLKLFAILEGRKGRLAIINNEILKTGDIIGDEKVLEIGRDSVVLVKKSTKRTIPIEEVSSEYSTKSKGKEGEK